MLLLLAGLIFAACSFGSGSDLEGVWEVERFRLDGTVQDVVPGVNVVRTPWVSIEGDSLRGEAGCNGLGGPFTTTGRGSLILEDVVMEAAFCLPDDSSGDDDDSVMQGDFAFAAVMWEGEVEVSMAGDEMVWSNGDDSISFRSVTAPPTTEPFVPPTITVIGRLDCAPGHVIETRVPDRGQSPLQIAQEADPNVIEVQPGEPLRYSGLDAGGKVIVELALGDAPGADYQVWTCEG